MTHCYLERGPLSSILRAAVALALACGAVGCSSGRQTSMSEGPTSLASGATSAEAAPPSAAGAPSAAPVSSDAQPDEMPKEAAFVLEKPDRLEIYTLEPSHEARGSSKRGGQAFHEYPIVGRAEVVEAATRARVVAAVYAGIRSSDGSIARCFEPRHGVHAVREGRTADLVICYECRQVQVFAPGSAEPKTLKTSPGVEAEVNRLFGSFGLRPPP